MTAWVPGDDAVSEENATLSGFFVEALQCKLSNQIKQSPDGIGLYADDEWKFYDTFILNAAVGAGISRKSLVSDKPSTPKVGNWYVRNNGLGIHFVSNPRIFDISKEFVTRLSRSLALWTRIQKTRSDYSVPKASVNAVHGATTPDCILPNSSYALLHSFGSPPLLHYEAFGQKK